MERFESSVGHIELTDERLGHILQFHPELKPHVKQFTKALAEPDFIKPSRRDNAVLIFYKSVSKSKQLAVVVKTNSRHFILTAYLIHTTRIKYENKKYTL